MDTPIRAMWDADALAERFKALGHPVRMRIFARLAQCCGTAGGVCRPAADGSLPCVGDLGDELGLPASTLSHHLKELERAGLILRRREGTNIRCWVDAATLAMLAGFFAQWLTPSGDPADDACC